MDFVKKIECDKVVNDFYPISNLIKEKKVTEALTNRSSSSGFMVERFVKPPVTLTLEFEKPLKITAVDIGLCVGSQKTSNLELYAGFSVNLLKKVASFYQSSNGNAVSFVRFCVKNKENEIENNFTGSVVYFYKTDQLTNCKFLAIKVCKAEHVPCLSALRIWSYQSVNLVQLTLPEENCLIEGASKEDKKDEERNDEEIPEDFFDPITCECMSLPIVLPAGRTIDRSTLERFISIEAACGRGPSDPYTGVKFTEHSFPLANVPLKGRIDKFFLDNPHLATKIQFGRTLCGKNYSAWPLKRY